MRDHRLGFALMTLPASGASLGSPVSGDAPKAERHWPSWPGPLMTGVAPHAGTQERPADPDQGPSSIFAANDFSTVSPSSLSSNQGGKP